MEQLHKLHEKVWEALSTVLLACSPNDEGDSRRAEAMLLVDEAVQNFHTCCLKIEERLEITKAHIKQQQLDNMQQNGTHDSWARDAIAFQQMLENSQHLVAMLHYSPREDGPMALAPTQCMLSSDDELFNLGNAERELLAKHSTFQITSEEQQEVMTALCSNMAAKLSGLWQQDSYTCKECHANLPTSHLLDIHLLEVHDSFFQAQVARRMSVFQCLVDGCSRTFVSPAHRLQHLVDLHHFPRNVDLARMHLHKHTSQPRPQAAFQKAPKQRLEVGFKQAANAAQCTASASMPVQQMQGRPETEDGGGSPHNTDASHSIEQSGHSSIPTGPSEKSGAGCPISTNSSNDNDDVHTMTGKMSRLSTGDVPEQFAFGRRGRGGMIRGNRRLSRRGGRRGMDIQ